MFYSIGWDSPFIFCGESFDKILNNICRGRPYVEEYSDVESTFKFFRGILY